MSQEAAGRIRDLPSPSLLIDLDRLERNIAAAAAAYAAAGIDLRPHVKTSKCLEVARRQIEAGAIGHTCSTPAEVQWLAAAGWRNLLWAHAPVGPIKVDFAVRAAAEHDLIVAVDSLAVAGPLGKRAADCGVEVRVVMEVDTGQNRVGVQPEDAVAFAAELSDINGIRLTGVLTHEGHLAAHGPDREGLEGTARGVGATLASVAGRLREAGHDIAIVSVGSTPGMTSAPFVDGVTEARPGTYVYFDANQMRLGSATIDQCAMTVLARVLSLRPDGSVIIDAGLKAMSADSLTPDNGAGLVCDLNVIPIEGVEFWTANEEHGFLRGAGCASLAVGDLVRIVPNHACGTTNMWSGLYAVSGDRVQGRWAIEARH